MKHIEYFDKANGHGFLATADSEGHVDLAVYAKPHIMDEDTFAFIMPDRLTHNNLQSNPYAAYLFMEHEGKLAGRRFFLKKIKEEKDTELLYSIRRKNYGEPEGRYLVYFHVEKILPLIGSDEGKGGDVKRD